MPCVENNNDHDIQHAFEALHLPHIPATDDNSSAPVLRILVVADLDLPSASALAEYSLQKNNLELDASMVDLCIACGSFARDEDLYPYLRGKNARGSLHSQQEIRKDPAANPFFYSREETAALEGLMTAALSQLESIVCRVVYCPGAQDPVTTLFSDRSRRLTPNSRNLHQQWLPLAPGIGCAALLYLDSAEVAVKNESSSRPNRGRFDSDQDDASEGNEDEEDHPRRNWSERWLQVHRSLNSVGYRPSLEALIRLAPPPKHPVPFAQPLCQTILVTHYVDCSRDRSQAAEQLPVSRPWPTDPPLETFLRSEMVQNFMCLEIASGSASSCMPELIKQGNSQLLLPGSLRERGEFCILEMALEEELLTKQQRLREHEFSSAPSKPGTTSRSNQTRSFTWKLQKVDFHQLGRARDRI